MAVSGDTCIDFNDIILFLQGESTFKSYTIEK